MPDTDTKTPPEQLPARDWLLTRPTETPLPTRLDPANAGDVCPKDPKLVEKSNEVAADPDPGAIGRAT